MNDIHLRNDSSKIFKLLWIWIFWISFKTKLKLQKLIVIRENGRLIFGTLKLMLSRKLCTLKIFTDSKENHNSEILLESTLESNFKLSLFTVSLVSGYYIIDFTNVEFLKLLQIKKPFNLKKKSCNLDTRNQNRVCSDFPSANKEFISTNYTDRILWILANQIFFSFFSFTSFVLHRWCHQGIYVQIIKLFMHNSAIKHFFSFLILFYFSLYLLHYFIFFSLI